MRSNFYCQNKCVPTDFSIKEWNKSHKYTQENNLSEKETSEILEGNDCKEQCFDCMAIVGKRRKETQNLLKHCRYE